MRNSTPRWLQKMVRDALQVRREMVRKGELLPEDEFRLRRRVTRMQLARLTASGSVFSIEVDGAAYYPRLLVDPELNSRRLAYVCRILWPASPPERLHFLTSRSVALSAVTPLQALKDDSSYRRLLILARGWASEFSRTIVEICDNEFILGATPSVVCTGAVEMDPRVSIWRRAAEALEDGGNLWPDGPYPRASAATVLVSRGTAGRPGDVLEGRLDVLVSKGLAHTGVVVENYPRSDLEPVRVDKADDVVTVIRKILAASR